jgi:hypothetical protein
MKKFMALLFLAGCSTNAPNHIGNPLLLPVRGITTGIGNAVYNTRRNKVSRFVRANHNALKQDIVAGKGNMLTRAFAVARVPAKKHTELVAELQSRPDLYLTTNPEMLVITLMVYGP